LVYGLQFGAVACASRVNTCEIVQGRAVAAIYGHRVARRNLGLSCPCPVCENFSAACMDPKAFIDDAPIGEEAFVFGGFRLLPAQRLLLEDEKPVHLGSRNISWMCYSRSFKTQATHFTRINVFSANFRAVDSAASTAGGSPSVAVPLEFGKRKRGAKSIEGIERCRLLLRYE